MSACSLIAIHYLGTTAVPRLLKSGDCSFLGFLAHKATLKRDSEQKGPECTYPI